MTRLYQVVILILFGIILYLQMCKSPRPCPPAVNVTKRDTVWKKDSSGNYRIKPKPDTQYMPGKPYPVLVTKEDERVPYLLALVEDLRMEKPVDSEAVVKAYLSIHTDYFKVRTYSDSTVASYATAYSYDTVSQNRLIRSRLTLKQNTPVVTNTVSTKVRNQWYGGISIIGTKDRLLQGVEASLSLKNKKDQIYEAGVAPTFWGEGFQYRLGTKFKFSFKK